MEVFIERTEDHHLYTTWADINWHAVEENVRRLQERIYRATTNKAWRKVKNLQKLLVRATGIVPEYLFFEELELTITRL
jgi:hypothetical protein